ncbi:MAG: hypothetical protein QG648_84 [Patescibacteria group bacterium]|nr:hypothetical protein [Patescibacteria group bacterium]
MSEKLVGTITHYYDKIKVAIVELTGTLKVGDEIHIIGHEIDFKQQVSSMQIDHEQVTQAKKGDKIGLEVEQKVKEGCEVYLVSV